MGLRAANGARRRDAEVAPVVELAGDATDARTIASFHARCIAALAAGGSRLRLDLASVERADTKLVAAIVSLMRRAGAHGGVVEVVPSPAVRTAMGLCRLDVLASVAAS